jgi:hypothetical protein
MRNLRKKPCPIVTLSTSAPITKFHTPTSYIGWGSLRDNQTCKIWCGSIRGLNSSDLPEFCASHTHPECASIHPTFPTWLGTSNQSPRWRLFFSDSHCPTDDPDGRPEHHVFWPVRPNTRRRMDLCLPAFYHHRPPQLKTAYPLLHGKVSGPDWFDAVYHPDSQTHLDRLSTGSFDSI